MDKPPVQRETDDRRTPEASDSGQRSERDEQPQPPVEDETTGSEGGGPSVGYGKNPHVEPPQTRRK